MGRLNNDEQFKFLISCIRWSNNGKVDFSEVAKECNIVSKGAAAKRYERMMKAHGIHQPTNTARDTAVPPMRSKDQKTPKDAATKKRKLDEFDSANLGTTKQEGPSQGIKDELAADLATAAPIVKNEMTAEQNYPWLSYQTNQAGNNAEDSVFSNYFIESSAFEPINGQQVSLSERSGEGVLFTDGEGQAD